jgi:hypothetical protein
MKMRREKEVERRKLKKKKEIKQRKGCYGYSILLSM